MWHQRRREFCVIALGIASALGAAPALAGGVHWSIGIQAPIAPGVALGTVISGGPHGAVVRPAPVYAPAPVVYAPVEVIRPAPVYSPAPPAVYGPPPYGYGRPVVYGPPPVYVPVRLYPGRHVRHWVRPYPPVAVYHRR